MSDSPPPPSPPPPPPPPPPPEGTDAAEVRADAEARVWLEADLAATPRRRLATALVGLVVIAALVLSLVMVRRTSSGDDPADRSGDAPSTTEPEPATEEEVQATVAEISDFVAAERGLDFLAPVDVELEGEGAFQDRLLADFDEDADQLRETEVFLEG